MAAALDKLSEAVNLFQGYDSVLGAGRNIALTGTTEISGGRITSRIRVCEGVHEVMDELEINQSLTIGILGIVNISQKLEFINRQRITSNSICIVVYSLHVYGVEKWVDADRLENPPEGSAELKEFYQVYGDSYVSSITTGGEYFGVYSFYSQTVEEQRQLSVAMEAAGFFKAVIADVGLQAQISEFRDSTNVRVSFDQIMTGIANPAFPLPEDVIDFALDFPKLELTSPQLIHIETIGYQTVPGMGTRFNPIARNVQILTNADLAARWSHLQEVQAQVRSIMDVYKFYGGYADAKLQQVQKEVEADIAVVQAMVQSFDDDPSSPLVSPPAFSSLGHGTPTLEFVTRESDLHVLSTASSATQSTAFDNVPDIRRYLLQRTRIVAFEMNGSVPHIMENLWVTYNNGERSWTAELGTLARPDFRQLVVPEGESVVMVEGKSNPGSLRIALSNGESISMGGIINPSFVERTPDNFFLLGFRGRTDSRLSVIQTVYAAFSPAVWQI